MAISRFLDVLCAYANESEGNLEPRVFKCVFIWYLEEVKGYRLWVRDVLGVKIIVSKDVSFN